MAAPTYSTDLALIDDAQAVGSYTATGGGAAALNDETDYFINDTQCISKNGFTATQKGIIHDDVSAPSITAGDAVFIWARQANRNILDTVANSGGAVIMGTSNSVFAGFNVDGSNVDGSNLLSWVNYAVDPTQTNSYTSGSPGAASTWDHFGFEWKILGSGSLKGAPNAVGVCRHGREIRCVDGDLGNGYATFDGAAVFDAAITRRWGILTPVTGGYLFHGDFVMGQSGTSVDFRDSNRSIQVIDDPFVPSTFNEFEIINASSNVEWTAIQITALGTTAPFVLKLDVGDFTGDLCRFDGAGQTTFNTAGDNICTNSTWSNSGNVDAHECDLSGSSFLTPTVAADGAAVTWDETISTAHSITELDNTTFEMGTNSHHAVSFSTNVSDGANITLSGLNLNGFDADGTGDSNNSMFEFLATTGTITLTLDACFVDGVAASASNVTVDTRSGCTVNVVTGAVTVQVTTVDSAGLPIATAKVHLRASDATGPFPYQETCTISRSGTTATVTHTTHGMASNDKVWFRGISGNRTVDNTVKQITVTTASAYTYTTDDAGDTTYTGTVFLEDGQDETSYDNSPTTEGTFSGGTGHTAGDILSITGGSEVVVDVVSSGVITQFTVDAGDDGGGHSASDTLSQLESTGSGTGFSLTLDTDNITASIIKSTFVALNGDTNGSGVISTSRVYSTDQPVEGWSRKSSSSPYYKEGSITTTVDSANGLNFTAVMVSDE